MVSISGVTPALGLDGLQLKLPSFGKDRVYLDDPSADKVSLSGGQPEPALTYQHLAKNTSGSADSSSPKTKDADKLKEPDQLTKMMQQVLDAKIGVDRKKLEELDEKIALLSNKEGGLTDAEKTQLELLQKQKEQLIKEGAKKLMENQG